jgi:hypothetical protein
MNIVNTIKVVLAILFFICLADMPYGYFQLVRFIATISFGYFAYVANQKNQKNEVIIYIALALLFQPFIKIALGRTIWNIVDVIVAAGLLLSIFKDAKAKE